MSQMHISAGPKNKGHWVACRATKNCPNGGMHASSEALKIISQETYTPVKDLTKEDVVNYLGQKNQDAQPVKKKPSLVPLTYPDPILLDHNTKKQREFVIDHLGSMQDVTIDRDSKDDTISYTNVTKDDKGGFVSTAVKIHNASEDNYTLSVSQEINNYLSYKGVTKSEDHYDKDENIHRGDGLPASVLVIDDVVRNKIYAVHGKLHRDEDKPAIIRKEADGKPFEYAYYQHGELKRDRKDLPVRIVINNDEHTLDYSNGKGGLNDKKKSTIKIVR